MDLEAKPMDRSDWGPGPWDDEPDRLEWKEAGFPCMAIRNHMGVWCGYVGVPPGHPYYGKNYHDVEANVHGGLTYSAPCQGHICHVPEPGEPDDVWWLGFDCGHSDDFVPDMSRRLWPHDRENIYRTLEYVKKEITELAWQLANVH